MSKPVLLSLGAGKVQELAGTNDNDVLTWDAATSEWKAEAGGGSTVTMGGDVTGSSDDATVAKIQNIPISTTDPTTGKILQYDGTQWAPANAPQGGSGGGGVLYYLNKGTPVTGGNLPANTYQLGRTAEATQSSVALTNLATGSWTRVGGFVSDASDPSITTIPAGLWDFNFWIDTTAASNNQAYIRVTLYGYDGSTNPEAGTVLAQTDNIYLYDAGVIAQYIAAMLIAAGTTLPSTSTRLYLLVEARASTSNRDVTVYFGNSSPTHAHTTVPSVAGTGIVHVVDGVFQTPASAVDLESNGASGDVTGVLKLANGGTNAALTATAGGAAYGTGTALGVTGAGSAGTVLVSAGASAPSFTTIDGSAFGSQTANTVFAAPNGTAGNPTFRALAAADIPSLSSVYLPLSGGTLTGKLITVASATGSAGLNLPHGAAPTSPVNGDMWTTTGGMFLRLNGGTQTVGLGGTVNTWSNTNTFSSTTNNFGTSTATGTTNLASGATLSGSTKTVNIGTGGVAGSTTTITIGATAGTSTTTLNGTVSLANALSVGNGGTGATTLTGYVKGSGTSALTASSTIPTSDLSGSIALGSQVSGTLLIANGGTNNASLVVTQGYVYYGDGTKLVGLAPGTSGQFLQTQGAGANPQWASAATTTPYDLSGEFVGTPASGATIMRFVAARAFTFGGTAYFVCTSNTGATTAVFTVSVNGVSKGTVFILGNATSGTGTITSTSIAAGDLVSVVATTPANVITPYWTLPGTV